MGKESFYSVVSCSAITESMEEWQVEPQETFSHEEMEVLVLNSDDFLFLEDLGDTSAIGNTEIASDVVVHYSESSSSNQAANLRIPGLRSVSDPILVLASKGEEKQKSEHNNRWAMRRADSLQSALKWDMAIPLGDLPLEMLDELFSNLFTRAVKVDGGDYPSSTLMNMMNGFNRIIRRSSEIRAMNGLAPTVEKDFNINSHVSFARTRNVLRAAIKKSAMEGVNKKRNKVETLTLEMEKAILSDIDHQILSGAGYQKRLAFFCLVRLGIRGGSELWHLKRQDLKVLVDRQGRDYVQFEERESKNNSYSLQRYNEEQFRKTFHSYKEDFVVCVKQYMRHMPPKGEGTSPDLFLGAITNPVGNVWYSRAHKVSKDRSAKWLRNMLSLVGLPSDLFSNRSGRATLVTRLAAQGVPDEVGMMITGHHTSSGYRRYDRTQDVKMEAAALASAKPDLNYERALREVSKKFIDDDVVGNSTNLKPVVDRCMGNTLPLALTEQVQKPKQCEMVRVGASSKRMASWHNE